MAKLLIPRAGVVSSPKTKAWTEIPKGNAQYVDRAVQAAHRALRKRCKTLAAVSL